MSKWDTVGLSDRDRFWFYVEKSDGCWNWSGAKSASGYGRFMLGGKTRQSHRVSYATEVGDPSGLHVLHRCDNPACVRPDHLFLGTDADNADDKARKMRAGKSLNANQVAIIKARIASGEKLASIAADFGVSRKSIQRIKHQNTWRYP